MGFRKFLTRLLSNANERELDGMEPLVEQINDLESEYEALTDAQLGAKTKEFTGRLGDGESLEDLLVEAFAVVREASKRTTGLRHYDVQLMGGMALHRGRVVEMKTGEGKTLVATLPLYLNALTGKGTHLVTVNDYLARRDVQWMGPIYHLLGLQVGLLQQGQDQSFVFDPDYNRDSGDYQMLRPVPRREAYAAHMTYGTNSEFGFDYLRDNSVRSLQEQVQRGFYYAIVDEVDNILIDEARTPLIISGPSSEATEEYYLLAKAVRQLGPDEYEIEDRTRSITLTDAGYDHIEQILGMKLFDPEHPEEMTPQQGKLVHHLEQALKAEYVMQRNHDYIVQGQRVVIVDEFTGRTMPGRRWSDGLHQAVEAKESVPIQQENITYATITLQNYFRMYEKLAGMTGTAATEAEEFGKIYKLEVMILPTNRPVVRDDAADVILRTREGKFRAVVQDIVAMHCLGRPTLVGTTSVEVSEYLSKRLDSPSLRRWALVILLRERLNRRDVDNAAYREGMQILSPPLEDLSMSDLRKLAGKLEVSARPEDPENLQRLAEILDVTNTDCLAQVLARGIPYSVLNARYHTEEARLIARAGESGAVTIATNMAGRGVDIKLGGEIDEETLAEVVRVLEQNGFTPYGRSMEEMAQALRDLDPGSYYLYQDSVERFLRHVQDEKRVKELGGLHVLGTERHESRRIDNQLRGRSGRQGDPGSSRFYISLEDDLMRRFGGSRAKDLMARLGAEDDIPISMGIVSRAIANAQTQVEGYNFDIRKHLLEYDDVLNTQREVIYGQRRRILSKRDLRDDVWAVVEAEIKRRVDAVWAEQERDLSRLVIYLEHVQPTATLAEGQLFPSFPLQHVLSTLPAGAAPDQVSQALAELVRNVLDSQWQYILDSIETGMERALAAENESIDRLLEAAGTAYEEIEVEGQEEGRELTPERIVQAVAEQTGLSLDARPLQGLQGRQLERSVMDQVRAMAQVQVRLRLLGQVQGRINMELRIEQSLLIKADAQTLIKRVMDTLRQASEQQIDKLAQEIRDEIAAQVRRPQDCAEPALLNLLNEIRFGLRTGFDKSHRRVSRRVERFQYAYWVAEQLAEWDREQVESAVVDHLRRALVAWEDAWGSQELQRIGAFEWSSLEAETLDGLKRVLGEQEFARIAGQRVADLAGDSLDRVRSYLGQQVLFNVQRQLMLDITSRYWVEHLTAMEELRQGIGLQSYAQKDPLAEYKVRAYDMFQELLEAIQGDMVAAMFTYRPRTLSEVRVGVDRRKTPKQKPEGTERPGGKQRPRKKRRG